MATITDETHAYINERPAVRSCLRQGLINFSALARKIEQDTDLEGTAAIVIAARRLKRKLAAEDMQGVRTVLKKSELEVRNKMVVFILEKSIDFELIEQLQRRVKRDRGVMYVIEGSKSYTVITQESYGEKLREQHDQRVIWETGDVSLIRLTSPKEIEKVSGVVAYLTSLFAENGVNIVEFLSSWTDTLFVVHNRDVPNAMQMLQF